MAVKIDAFEGKMGMNQIRIGLCMGLLLAMAIGLPAQRSFIKTGRTRVIAKVDLFWSAVTVADNFPTFFPIAVEVNSPKKRFSVEATFTAGYQKFNTQSTINNKFQTFAGIGGRYYFFTPQGKQPATGFFVEPQYFLHFKRTFRDPIITPAVVTKDFKSGFFVGLGYQHVFIDWLYLQGRVSVGLGSDEDLGRYQFTNRLMVLPWMGIGVALH